MQITLYTNSSDNVKVNKTLANATVTNCNLKNETSIKDPIIELSGNNSIVGFNYAFIPDFNRYYYITGITNVRNGLYRLTMSVDVLMSFKSQFLNCQAIIERQQNSWNKYLEDGKILTYSDTFTVTKKFPVELSNSTYILTVAGGD